MKKITKFVAALSMCAAFAACNQEAKLLETKAYMEAPAEIIEVDDQSSINLDLASRLTSKYGTDVNVTFTIEGEEAVAAYNAKYSKEYLLFSTASLDNETSVIKAGSIYSEPVALQLNELGSLDLGSSYLLPVRVSTCDVPVIDGSDMVYYEIRKPVKLTKAAVFRSSYIKTALTSRDVFENVTYEAIVNVSSFGANNTVMGCEGVMIMRIGDAGGGTVPRDILQMAGNSEMTWTGNPLKAGQWYHLAFTCSSEGVGNLYVNGECVIPNGSFKMSSDLTAGDADFGFSIGQVPNFMWGSRPFNGLMAEVRVWNVVRTPAQIKENMLNVKANTPGLVAYYKLDGVQKNYVLADGETDNTRYYNISFKDLDKPIAIGGGL